MKRIFALIISLMLVMCLLAACGDDDTYRQPGTGTTLGGNVTTPAIDDQNGSYSADPDGEVNQTTDENILEDGINDIENGIDQGMDDLEQGLDDIGDGMEDMLDGNDNTNGTNGMNGANDVNGNTDMNGTNGDVNATGGMDSEGNTNTDGGYSNGSTNGNSR